MKLPPGRFPLEAPPPGLTPSRWVPPLATLFHFWKTPPIGTGLLRDAPWSGFCSFSVSPGFSCGRVFSHRPIQLRDRGEGLDLYGSFRGSRWGFIFCRPPNGQPSEYPRRLYPIFFFPPPVWIFGRDAGKENEKTRELRPLCAAFPLAY